MENNQFVVRGELTQCVFSKVGEHHLSLADIIIKVRRQWPCEKGYHEYDYIPIQVWRTPAEHIRNLVGETIEVSGRISIGKNPNSSVFFISEHLRVRDSEGNFEEWNWRK